jgi:uncharacterized membrane protein YbhN (UPF0104 family)
LLFSVLSQLFSNGVSHIMYLAKVKTYLPYFLLVLALLLFGHHLYSNADRYGELFDFSLDGLLVLTFLAIVSITGSGVVNYIVYRALGANLTLNEGVGLAAINTLANQLPFAGGMVAKGVYLKQHHRLSYVGYVSATFALFVFFLAVNGAIGLSTLAYLFVVQGTAIPNLLFWGFLVMVSSIIFFWLPINISLSSTKWNQRIAQLTNGWQILRRSDVLGKLIAVQTLMILVVAGRFWIAFNMLSQEVTLVECILFSSATILTHLVAITPGGLGVREAIVAGIASMFHFELGIALVAVSLDRLVSTLVIVGMGTVYTYILSKNVSTLSK